MSTTRLGIPAPPSRIEQEDVRVDHPGFLILLAFLALGILFGVILIKSEVVSWFRIQEMFRFQSFHMYGVLGSAVVTAALSVRLMKAMGLRALGGQAVSVTPKQLGGGYRYWLGGSMFGLGWALTGACPGPILALIGFGVTPYLLVLAAALVGTWTYAQLRPHLPH